jgi:hypothetical protein
VNIRKGLLSGWHDAYFQQLPDACGLQGASTDQKMTAAFRALAYGNSAGIYRSVWALGRVEPAMSENDVPRNCRRVRGRMVAASSRERAAAVLQVIRSNGVSWLLGRRGLRQLDLGRVSDGVGRGHAEGRKTNERQNGGYFRRISSRLVV